MVEVLVRGGGGGGGVGGGGWRHWWHAHHVTPFGCILSPSDVCKYIVVHVNNVGNKFGYISQLEW